MSKIRNRDIFEDDLFEKQKKSALEFLKVYKRLEKELKEGLKGSKQNIVRNMFKDSGDLKRFQQGTREAKAAMESLTAIEKERIKLHERMAKATGKGSLANAKLNEQLKQERLNTRQLAQEKNKLLGAYKNESARLNRLRKSYKDLAAAGKENTREAKNLRQEVVKLDSKLKRIDESVGQSQRNVGNYRSALKGLGNTFRQVAGAAGLGLGIAGIFQGGRNAINVVKDYGQAQADLAAVLNKTREETKLLAEDSRRLGGTTRFTASEVSLLQKEYAKLGFSQDEIINATESTLALASATNHELAPSAEIVGSTLRAFRLDVSETSRVVDVLGKSTSASALDMNFFETAMSKVAPVAVAAGFSIEETTALLGSLANAGFDASTAATSTKNIILNLADSNGDLAKSLGKPVKGLNDLIPALKELDAKGIDLAKSLELTDQRSVAAFQTFLEGADSVEKLDETLDNAEGSVKKMADTQLNTLQGSLDLLNSAWQEQILSAADAGSAFFSLKEGIRFLADNLSSILKIVKAAAIAFISFKAAIAIQRTVTGVVQGLRSMRTGLIGLTTATKGFGAAMRSIPLAGLISGITTGITLLADFAVGADEAAEAQERLNEAIDGEIEALQELNEAREKNRRKEFLEIEQKVAEARAAGATEAELKEVRRNAIEEKTLSIMRDRGSLEIELRTEKERVAEIEEDILDKRETINRIQDDLNKKREQGLVSQSEMASANETLRKIKEQIRDLSNEITISEAKQAELLKEIDPLKQQELDLDRERKLVQIEINAEKEKEKKKLKSQLDLLKAQLKQLEKLKEISVGEETQTVVDRTIKLQGKIEGLEKTISDLEFILSLSKKELEEFGEKMEEMETIPTTKIDELPAKLDAITDKTETATAGMDGMAQIMAGAVDSAVDEFESDAERMEDAIRGVMQVADAWASRTRRNSQERINAINEELRAVELRQERLRELAEQGQLDAKRSLAAEEQRQRELELEREREQRRQQLREAGLAAFKAYGAKVEAGDETPLASTLRDMTALVAFIKALPAFKEGTADTGEGGSLDKDGGFLSVLHKRERVLTAEQNKELGYGAVSNDEIVQGFKVYKQIQEHDSIMRTRMHDATAMRTGWGSNDEVLSQMNKMNAYLQDLANRETLSSIHYDEQEKAIIETVTKRNKITRRHNKTGGIF